jgi:hypothetical protein
MMEAAVVLIVTAIFVAFLGLCYYARQRRAP